MKTLQYLTSYARLYGKLPTNSAVIRVFQLSCKETDYAGFSLALVFQISYHAYLIVAALNLLCKPVTYQLAR